MKQKSGKTFHAPISAGQQVIIFRVSKKNRFGIILQEYATSWAGARSEIVHDRKTAAQHGFCALCVVLRIQLDIFEKRNILKSCSKSNTKEDWSITQWFLCYPSRQGRAKLDFQKQS